MGIKYERFKICLVLLSFNDFKMFNSLNTDKCGFIGLRGICSGFCS